MQGERSQEELSVRVQVETSLGASSLEQEPVENSPEPVQVASSQDLPPEATMPELWPLELEPQTSTERQPEATMPEKKPAMQPSETKLAVMTSEKQQAPVILAWKVLPLGLRLEW